MPYARHGPPACTNHRVSSYSAPSLCMGLPVRQVSEYSTNLAFPARLSLQVEGYSVDAETQVGSEATFLESVPRMGQIRRLVGCNYRKLLNAKTLFFSISFILSSRALLAPALAFAKSVSVSTVSSSLRSSMSRFASIILLAKRFISLILLFQSALSAPRFTR